MIDKAEFLAASAEKSRAITEMANMKMARLLGARCAARMPSVQTSKMSMWVPRAVIDEADASPDRGWFLAAYMNASRARAE